MSRLFAVLLMLLSCLAAHAQPGLPWKDQVQVPGAQSVIEVVYLTSPDCGYCRSWRHLRNGGWARAQDSGLAAHVRLVEVIKRTLRDPIGADHYPEALRFLHQRHPGMGNRIPAWWVLVDGQPVWGGVGEGTWDVSIAPLLDELARARAAGGAVVALKRPALRPDWNGAARAGQPLRADMLPMEGEQLRQTVQAYLDMPTPKALALSEAGEADYQAGAGDVAQRVLSRCAARSAFRCHLLAVDDQARAWPAR